LSELPLPDDELGWGFPAEYPAASVLRQFLPTGLVAAGYCYQPAVDALAFVASLHSCPVTASLVIGSSLQVSSESKPLQLSLR
jgi:hypothetical protein